MGCAGFDGHADIVEVDGTRESVQVAESEQLECRCNGAHHDVLGGGFGTQLVFFVPGRKCIHRDGSDFETQEEREHVACRDDGEPAEGGKGNRSGEFRKLVHLRFSVGTMLKVVLREPHAEHGRQHEYFAHEYAKIVYFPVADEKLADIVCEGNEVQQDKDGDKADVRDAPWYWRPVATEKSAADDDEREQQEKRVGNNEVR